MVKPAARQARRHDVTDQHDHARYVHRQHAPRIQPLPDLFETIEHRHLALVHDRQRLVTALALQRNPVSAGGDQT